MNPADYVTLPIFAETGYVILDAYDQAADPREWEDITYVDWKSSGDTRFAPLASAYGEVECNGFWNHTPPTTDKDGVWVEENVAVAPRLVARAQEPGANIGRCRVIELQPNTYGEALYNLHRDDNNRLNPEGTGWIVRAFFNLTDDPDTFMVLREDRDDPTTETRIPLPAGTQAIIDTQRLWHAVWHPERSGARRLHHRQARRRPRRPRRGRPGPTRRGRGGRPCQAGGPRGGPGRPERRSDLRRRKPVRRPGHGGLLRGLIDPGCARRAC